MIFDHNNPRHMEILREELTRAKHIMFEEIRDDWSENTLAVKDKTLGLPLYRGISSMLREDPRYDRLLASFLRRVDKVTLEDLSIKEINHFFDLLIKFRDKIAPDRFGYDTNADPNKTALDADSYKAGQGRGGWQGD
jgi:hypothetical protein